MGAVHGVTTMRKLLAILLCLGLQAVPAAAALKVGDAAPDFTAPATLGGQEFTFHLKEALKKGPVVVYFYPAAFTKGCTIEAHDFAEAMPDFRAAGASVIGVSHDDIATLNKFSVSECQSKFPVAADRDHEIGPTQRQMPAATNPSAPWAQVAASHSTTPPSRAWPRGIVSPQGVVPSIWRANGRKLVRATQWRHASPISRAFLAS